MNNIQDLDNIETVIMKERLRQARYSFNIALFSTVTCVLSGLIGIGLVLMGKTPEGSIMTTGSTAPIALCIHLAKDSNKRLDKIFQELQDNDHIKNN